MEPIPPLPATPSKIHRIRLVGSKSAGGRVFVVVVVVAFSSKCKTIRPGTVKGSKTDPKRDQKANTN